MRLLVGGSGMAQRHVMAVRHQVADQVEPAVDLRCEGHDADVRPRRRDLCQDVFAGPVRSAFAPAALRRDAALRRQPQAVERLRAFELGIDESCSRGAPAARARRRADASCALNGRRSASAAATADRRPATSGRTPSRRSAAAARPSSRSRSRRPARRSLRCRARGRR